MKFNVYFHCAKDDASNDDAVKGRWKYLTIKDPKQGHVLQIEYIIPGIDEKVSKDTWYNSITYMVSCINSIFTQIYNRSKREYNFSFVQINPIADDRVNYQSFDDKDDSLLVSNIIDLFCKVIPSLINVRLPYNLATKYLRYIVSTEYMCKKFFYLDSNPDMKDRASKTFSLMTEPNAFRYQNFLPYRGYIVDAEVMRDHYFDDIIEDACFSNTHIGYIRICDILDTSPNAFLFFKNRSLSSINLPYCMLVPNPKLIDLIIYSGDIMTTHKSVPYQFLEKHYFYTIMRSINIAFFHYLEYPSICLNHFVEALWDVEPAFDIDMSEKPSGYFTLDIRRFIADATDNFANYIKNVK